MQHPAVLGAAGVVALVIVVLLVRRRMRGGARRNQAHRELERLVAAGKYAEAAEVAMREGMLGEAMSLYQRAQLPEQAAEVAVRLGKHAEAAALFARAEAWERAAASYERAGLADEAAAARAHLDAPAEVRSPEVAAARLDHGDLRGAAAACRDAGLVDEAVHLYVDLLGEPAEAAAILAAAGDEAAAAELEALAAHWRARPAPPATDRPEGDAEAIARAAARAAAEALRSRDDMAEIMAASRGSQHEPPRAGDATEPRPAATGLEGVAVPVELLTDTAMRAARAGPRIDTLRRFIGDDPCDLQSIEPYYRLALAHLADGNWDEALATFDAVEQASPAYRDAGARADAIRAWKSAHGDTLDVGPTGDERRFQLRGELGRGDTAVVYRARDTRAGRDVALEVFTEDLATADELARFEREARALAAFEHPNLVAIHDHGLLAGRAFLCADLVLGTSADLLVAAPTRPPVLASLRLIDQVLDALAYAHDRDVVHRDVRPANIMRTTTGVVKLLDFGLAKSVDRPPETPYTAPEQRRGEPPDARADLYGVGVTLYQLVTGQLPSDAVDRGPPPVLAETLSRALAPDPADRFPSATAMATPIRALLNALPSPPAGGGSGWGADRVMT